MNQNHRLHGLANGLHGWSPFAHKVSSWQGVAEAIHKGCTGCSSLRAAGDEAGSPKQSTRVAQGVRHCEAQPKQSIKVMRMNVWISLHHSGISPHHSGISTHYSGISTHHSGISIGVHTRSVGVHTRNIGVHTRSIGVHTRSIGVHTRSVGVHTQSVGVHTRAGQQGWGAQPASLQGEAEAVHFLLHGLLRLRLAMTKVRATHALPLQLNNETSPPDPPDTSGQSLPTGEGESLRNRRSAGFFSYTVFSAASRKGCTAWLPLPCGESLSRCIGRVGGRGFINK
jgi:hypothetical protein